MARPGDVVTVDFPGATGVKRRPTVVISSALYHAHHPDLILGMLTTRLASPTTPTDYLLQDWSAAGRHQPCAFRAYLVVVSASTVRVIGQLSDRDWEAVQVRVGLSLCTAPPAQP